MNPTPVVNFVNDLCNRLNQFESRIRTIDSRVYNVYNALNNRITFIENRLNQLEPSLPPIPSSSNVTIIASSGPRNGTLAFTYEGINHEFLFTQYSETGETWLNHDPPMLLSGGCFSRAFIPPAMKYIRLATFNGTPVSNVFTLPL
jgi:hypothetical protein